MAEFAVGPCNRVAHASALSVVEEPSQGANPLVFHGTVGTGKTHLLEGIYVGLRKGHPDWQVRFVTAEDFTNRFLPAMRLGKLGAFRKFFRECDALLIDDVHFLAGKKGCCQGSGDTAVQARLEEQAAPSPEDAALWDQEYDQHLLARAVEQVRACCHEATWQAFRQTALEGKKARDVAAMLGMSVASVYVAKSRVLGLLKKCVCLLREE